MSKTVDFMKLSGRLPHGQTVFLRREYDALWRHLKRVAGWYRRRILTRTRLVAVVGSLGKTTTKRAVEAALDCPDRRQSFSNYGSNLAGNLLRLRPGDRHGVLEAGIAGTGWMAQYAALIRPDLVVVTAIMSEHNRSFATLFDTREEKAHMVRSLPERAVAILNGDDPHVRWMATQTRARVVTYGLNDDNEVRASEVAADGFDLSFKAHLGGATWNIQSRLIGTHMVYPLLAALAVAHAEKLDLRVSVTRLSQLAPTTSRMELIALPDGTRLLDDSYKGALESVHAAFATVSRLPASRRIVVLGNVEEPPGREGDIYRDLGARLAVFADHVICIGGNNMTGVRAGAKQAGMNHEAIQLAGSRIPEAMKLLKATLQPGDLVLFKGSSTQRLRRMVLQVLKRDVSCAVKYCGVKVRCCDDCPLLGAPEACFQNPLVSRYLRD